MASARDVTCAMPQVAHKKAPKVALDPLERAERIVTTAAQLSPPVAPFLTPGHLVDGAEPLMQALAAELFTTHPGLHTSGAEYKAMHNVLARVIIAWDGVVPALAVLGAEEALPAEGDLDSDLWRSGEGIMNGRSVRAAGESAALFSRGQDEDGKSGAATPASYIARHARGFRRFDNDKSCVACVAAALECAGTLPHIRCGCALAGRGIVGSRGCLTGAQTTTVGRRWNCT